MDKKDGVSVQEIENFAKKYKSQLIFCLAFILASLFSYIFFSPGWSMFLAAIGAIVAILFPINTDKIIFKCFAFVGKQEKVTQMVIAGVFLVLSIVVPFVTFLFLGLMGGLALTHHAAKMRSTTHH